MGFVQVTSPLKQFFWDAKDNRTVGRGIGGYYTNDTYTLNVIGNFAYTVGIRWWAKGNRKTTATATIQSNLVNEIQGTTYSPTAANDTDNNVILTIRTGNYATSFTISGNVGASGDVIIITEIYAQITLRGNNADSLGNFGYWELLIKEKGMMVITARNVATDFGNNAGFVYAAITKNGYDFAYQTTTSTNDITVSNLTFASNDSPEIVIHANGQDYYALSMFIYINIIIIGA